MRKSKTFLRAMKNQLSDEMESLYANNQADLIRLAKRAGIWILVLGGIVLFVVLLPMLMNHIADTVLAYKNIQKAVKA